MGLSKTVKLSNAERQRVFWLNDFEMLIKQKIYFANDSLDAGRGTHIKAIPVLANDIVTAAWIKVNTACPTNATVDLGYGSMVNYWGNALPLDGTGVVSTLYTASDTWDFDRVPRGTEGDNTEIEVPNVATGDVVSLVTNIDTLGLDFDISVPKPPRDRVVVHVTNNTPDNYLYPEKTTMTVTVNKAPWATHPWHVTAADTIDITATTDFADVDINSGVIELWARVVRAR